MNKPLRFLSSFRHGVDEKRRVQLPAKWRPADTGTELTLMLWSNGDTRDACLRVLSPARMEALEQKLAGMSLSDPKATALRRLLGQKSAGITLDKSGRFCLPEHMANAVGIGKEVQFVGLVDCFEIWEPSRYEQALEADKALEDEASKLI